MEYQVLAYYLIDKLEDPHAEVSLHKDFLTKRDFSGRIYISEQGINGQSCGSKEAAREYMDWMQSRFPKIIFKIHTAKEHIFPKMTIKYRKQLVAIDCDVDFSDVGQHVSPKEWKEMLEERDENTMVIDVRNDYEWKIGHFEGSELPELETFRQFPEYARKLKEQKDPKTTCVMMCCTGGIRCEFFSAVLKKEGFEKVYQLDGGIINYGLQEKGEHWRGKLFVFDDRLAVSVGGDEAPLSVCLHCKQPNDVYYNCANMDCNELFLCCISCLHKYLGACSEECKCAERLRPYHEDPKPFRKYASLLPQ